VYLLVFHAYINEMHGSRNKIPVNNIVRQRCAEGFNSGAKGLKIGGATPQLRFVSASRVKCELPVCNILYCWFYTHESEKEQAFVVYWTAPKPRTPLPVPLTRTTATQY
jgi:hypothetical protein